MYSDEKWKFLNKAERDYDIYLYQLILSERNQVTSEIFDVLKMIRDTSENDEEFGKNVKLFIKNR